MGDFGNIFLSRPDIDSLSAPKHMLEPQYQSVYDSWKQQDNDDTRNAVLKAMSPLLDRTVNSIGGADKNYLRIQAKVLLLNSLAKYDPKSSALETYMTHQLMPLRRMARQQTNILGLPERMVLAASQLESAETEMADDLGRAPTTAELSDKLHISQKQIERIRRLAFAHNSGYYATANEEGEVSQSPAVARSLPDEYKHQFVLSALKNDPKSALIYEYDNAIGGRLPISTAELAKKLGLTAGAISQRRNRIGEIVNNAERAIYG